MVLLVNGCPTVQWRQTRMNALLARGKSRLGTNSKASVPCGRVVCWQGGRTRRQDIQAVPLSHHFSAAPRLLNKQFDGWPLPAGIASTRRTMWFGPRATGCCFCSAMQLAALLRYQANVGHADCGDPRIPMMEDWKVLLLLVPSVRYGERERLPSGLTFQPAVFRTQ